VPLRLKALVAVVAVALTGVVIGIGSSMVAPEDHFASPLLESSSSEARAWFTKARTSCNPVEVSQFISMNPPPAGWDGAGFAAGCEALAGQTADARRLIERLPPEQRWRAAGLVFDVGHRVADNGGYAATASLMQLVVAFWPNHYEALFHAAMSEFALGQLENARRDFRLVLSVYPRDDAFRLRVRNMLRVVESRSWEPRFAPIDSFHN